MAVFSVLGIALIALLRQSTAFLERGTAGSETLDTLENVDRTFADDFANVYIRPSSNEGMPDARMLCDRIGFDTDGDGSQDTWTPRLSFARSVKGEASDVDMRGAGSKAGAAGYKDGIDDEQEAEGNQYRAPGGKQEVLWFLVPGMKSSPRAAAAGGQLLDEDLALGTLYRKDKWPLGGTKSLLPQEAPKEPKPDNHRMGITTRKEAEDRLMPVLGGVLHLSFRFWTRHTKPEAARLVASGRLVDEIPPEVGGGGLTPTWDSTRGILPPGRGPDAFFLGKGPGSREDPVDDVFPARVRMTLVVDRIGKDAATGELARSVGPEDTLIPVDSTKFAPGVDPASRFVKIDREWIQWATRDGVSFTVEKRGARGTRREAHDAGSVVRAGATLVREYSIPSYREDWND